MKAIREQHSDRIFVDVARTPGTPDEYTDPVCDGIELLSRELGYITLGKIVDDYAFEKPVVQMDIDKLRFTRRTADLHAIVTHEPIRIEEKRRILGVSHVHVSDYVLGNP